MKHPILGVIAVAQLFGFALSVIWSPVLSAVFGLTFLMIWIPFCELNKAVR